MSEMTEQGRRNLAFKQRGQVSDDLAEVVEPRRMQQMMSLRLDSDMVAALRDVASQRGVSVSDLLREGANWVIASRTENSHLARISYRSSVSPGRSFTGTYDVLVLPASGYWPSSDSDHPAAAVG